MARRQAALMAAAGYATLWEFTVLPARQADFEAQYGPAGRWVALFRQAPGYLGSELLRDVAEPLRYVTIDRWQSADAYRAFRRRFAAEYERLDREFEGWTTREAPLGELAGPAPPSRGDDMTVKFPLEGGCDCRAIRYRMETAPLFVHCCHCRWCQRESGASFALNAMIEADRVTLLGAAPELVDTPSASGKGQKIARCPRCRIALWSHYAGAGTAVSFVRVGTLDDPDALPPDIHIFTASKQPWVVLPPGTPAVPEYYDRAKLWPAESLARREALLARRRT